MKLNEKLWITFVSIILGVIFKLTSVVIPMFFMIMYFNITHDTQFNLSQIPRANKLPALGQYLIISVLAAPIIENLIFIIFRLSKVRRIRVLYVLMIIISIIAWALHGMHPVGYPAAIFFFLTACQYVWLSKRFTSKFAYWQTVLTHMFANIFTYLIIFARTF